MKRQTIKTILYAVLTVAFLGLAVFYHNGVHKIETVVECYLQVQRWILLIGAVLLGCGISFRKASRADAWFVSLLGVSLLVFFVISFVQFGGMGELPGAAGYAAVNAQMLAIDGAMVACFVRCAVCVAGMRDADRGPRLVARITCAVVAVLLVCLLIMGYGTSFARYDEAEWEAYTYSAF